MQLVAESVYRLGRRHHNVYAIVDQGFAREVAESGVPVEVHEAEAPYASDGSQGRQVQPTELPLWRPRCGRS